MNWRTAIVKQETEREGSQDISYGRANDIADRQGAATAGERSYNNSELNELGQTYEVLCSRNSTNLLPFPSSGK
jgi:hypothetical protein